MANIFCHWKPFCGQIQLPNFGNKRAHHNNKNSRCLRAMDQHSTAEHYLMTNNLEEEVYTKYDAALFRLINDM